MSSACKVPAEKLLDCYINNTAIGEFDCAGKALPTSANCADKVAAVVACEAGTTGPGANARSTGDAVSGADASPTDASSTDAVATDAATGDSSAADVAATDTGSGGADTSVTDVGSGITCPCFDEATIKDSHKAASSIAGSKPGVSMASGGQPTVYGGCFYQKGATEADFGKSDKVNWVVITALDSADAEVYNGWFIAGPTPDDNNVVKPTCGATKGDSKAKDGPAEVLKQGISDSELNACVQVLVDVKAALDWSSCGEQHLVPAARCLAPRAGHLALGTSRWAPRAAGCKVPGTSRSRHLALLRSAGHLALQGTSRCKVPGTSRWHLALCCKVPGTSRCTSRSAPRAGHLALPAARCLAPRARGTSRSCAPQGTSRCTSHSGTSRCKVPGTSRCKVPGTSRCTSHSGTSRSGTPCRAPVRNGTA